MVWAPLSEVPQIGRMPIYIITLAIFVLLQIPTALATNYGMLMAFRFLTGLFGSPILATGGATIADLYSPKKRAYGMTIWGVFATCAPSLGPLLGSFSAHFEGWRWTIWELMWLSAATLVLLFFFYPETSASNILYRRARRLRKATGNPSIMSASEVAVASMSPRDLAADVLVRPFTLNFQEPIVFVLNVYIGLIYALLLRTLWAPTGLHKIADAILHDLVPLAYTLWWIGFAPKGGLRWRQPLRWLAYPLAYFGFSVVLGSLTGRYLYPFVDLGALGVATLLRNAVLLGMLFWILGLGAVGLDRALSRAQRAP